MANSKKGEGRKVLVVEDEKTMARALEKKLRSSGFEPRVAVNGEEALEVLEKERFDLILLDLIMPQKDGFSVLRELKDRGNEIPIVVATNLGQDEDVKKAESLGAEDYFIKSNVALSEIMERVENILKRNGRKSKKT